jgi:hypothetical protein
VILVDTHVVVWLAFEQGQLSKKARATIDDARKNGDGLAISDITLLELATLASQGAFASISAANHFQQIIPKIRPTALSQPPRWSKGYPLVTADRHRLPEDNRVNRSKRETEVFWKSRRFSVSTIWVTEQTGQPSNQLNYVPT